MKKLIIALLALGMLACHQPENTSLKVVEVDVNSADYRKDEAAFKHFDFVKLDTVSESLLSDVSKVLVGEERLYVLPMMDPRVFIFSKEGKYIHSLKRGQGPGEIRFVYDMDLHDGNLYVYDNYRTIRKYDKDGNFLEDVYTQDDYNLLMKVVEDQILLFDPYFNARQEHLLTL
ncbi:MAG: 6-bladed beta-propeller [Bacteroidaceae bacterium]|nr:6-bladed beta-propeller [Bacteroidaceae bacterium]